MSSKAELTWMSWGPMPARRSCCAASTRTIGAFVSSRTIFSRAKGCCVANGRTTPPALRVAMSERERDTLLVSALEYEG